MDAASIGARVVYALSDPRYDKCMKRSVPKRRNLRETLFFIAIAVGLMVAIHFLMNGGRFVPEPETALSHNDAPAYFKTSLQYDSPGDVRYYSVPALEEGEFEAVIAAYAVPEEDVEVEIEDVVPEVKGPPKQAKKAPVYEPIQASGSPKIAIIIDDMGVDRKRSFQVLEIDAPLTLAFLPYAGSLEGITRQAKASGHELIIHMPMEAMTNPVSLGPIALKDGMSADEVRENLEAAFESFEGYVGLNNHMGSRVTQNAAIMDVVMESLKERDLYFIDSKTINSSVAAETARLNGLDTAVRDVFLDHQSTPEFVEKALRKTEEVAARKGYAIAIGHPKDATIEGLQGWVDDVRRRGFEIVHASALLERPRERFVSRSLENAAKIVQAAQPASGHHDAFDADDPNSPEARAAILKKLFGQVD